MACDAEVHASNYITLRSLSEFLCVVRISSDPTKALDQLLKRGAQSVRVLRSSVVLVWKEKLMSEAVMQELLESAEEHHEVNVIVTNTSTTKDMPCSCQQFFEAWKEFVQDDLPPLDDSSMEDFLVPVEERFDDLEEDSSSDDSYSFSYECTNPHAWKTSSSHLKCETSSSHLNSTTRAENLHVFAEDVDAIHTSTDTWADSEMEVYKQLVSRSSHRGGGVKRKRSRKTETHRMRWSPRTTASENVSSMSGDEERIVERGGMTCGPLVYEGNDPSMMLRPQSFKDLLDQSFTSRRTIGDGACGLHAAFGLPNERKSFFLPNARDFATASLGPSYQALTQRVGKSMELQQLGNVLWNELALPSARRELQHLERSDLTNEQAAFWSSLNAFSPELHQVVLHRAQEEAFEDLQKEKLLANLREAAALFFDQRWEVSLIRPLAVALKFLPDINIDVHDPVEVAVLAASFPDSSTFLVEPSEIRGSREVVRTSNIAFPVDDRPTSMYSALFDPRECFDALRMLFFDCSYGNAEKLKEEIGVCFSLCQDAHFSSIVQRIHAVVEEMASFRLRRHQDAPSEFVENAWPAFLQAIKSEDYFFSCDEIAVMAQSAKRNLIITKQLRDDSSYHIVCCSHCTDEPYTVIAVDARAAGPARSHFERLENTRDTTEIGTSSSTDAEVQNITKRRKSHPESASNIAPVPSDSAMNLTPLCFEDIKSGRVRKGQMVSGVLCGESVSMHQTVAAREVTQLVGELFQPCRTTGDGACGMHAAFGQPNGSGELFMPGAREHAIRLLGPSLEEQNGTDIYAN